MVDDDKIEDSASGFEIELDDELAGQAETIEPPKPAHTLLNISVDTATQAPKRKSEHLSTGQFSTAGTKRTPTGHIVTSSVSGRYEIKREFARGGMGRILIAFDESVGREVALKELLPNIEDHVSSSGSTGMVDRFLREAKITGQLEHPNIVPVYEIGQREDGRTYYTMKFVQGKTLESRLRAINGDESIDDREKLSRRLRLLEQFLNVCHAIAYAHSRRVIHRDLKPANIMLGDFGETLVLDWGLARVLDQPLEDLQKEEKSKNLSSSLLPEDSGSKTLDGAVLGTPAYMPPEQARGEITNVDELSDVYSLGAILYEILAGHAPFVGERAQTILARVQVTEPDKLTPLHGAPTDLIALCDSAMAREKTDRLPSAAKLADEIAAYRDGRQLSVYRYTASEKIWRFFSRHTAAVVIATIAIAAMVTGSVVSFQRVSDERDAAEVAQRQAEDDRQIAQTALKRADKEEKRRILLQENAQKKRQELIDARQSLIDAQVVALNVAGLDIVIAAAQEQWEKFETDSNRSYGATLTELDENKRLLQDLMSGARKLDVLIELETRPIEGSYHEFAAREQIEKQRARLLELQKLTRDIAVYNNDFALADFVLNQMAIDSTELAKGLEEIDASRAAILTARGIEIEKVLKEIRDGLGRPNRPKHLPDLEEYIQNISSYRDPQTFLAISRALSGLFAFELTKERRNWTGAQRDEIIFCCRVLGYLQLPEMTVTALDMAGEALTDERMLVEVGRALCRTKHHSAEGPIERLRARLKDKAHIWAQILALYKMVPNSPLPENPTAEEILTRAEVMIVKEQPIAARKLLEPRASELTDSPQFHYLLGLTWGASANGVMQMHRAIELDSKNTKAHQRLAGFYAYMKKADKAEEMALKSTTLAPEDWRSWHVLGFVYTLGGESKRQKAISATTRALELNPQNYAAYTNRAAMYIYLGEFEKAELDLSRALYFNPRHAEAYINRSICRRNLGDNDGAIQDCNRLLEFFPDHMWGIVNRADAYFEIEDYQKAVLDYSTVIERGGGPLAAAYFGRAKSYRKLDELDAAADDMYDFLDEFPDHERTVEAEALLEEIEKELDE